jgi:hypothetical protein
MCYGETLSAALVRARKQHTCDDCGRAIQPGKHYQRTTSVERREISTTKVCRTCYLAATEHPSLYGEVCWTLSDGQSRDSLREEPWQETLAWMREAWARLRGQRMRRWVESQIVEPKEGSNA